MDLNVADAEKKHIYNLMIGLVAPRPIAWITSMNAAGQINAAPFSAYNYMGMDPPIVAIGVGNRPGPGMIRGGHEYLRHRLSSGDQRIGHHTFENGTFADRKGSAYRSSAGESGMPRIHDHGNRPHAYHSGASRGDSCER